MIECVRRNMARTVRKGEAFTWHHVVRATGADVEFVADLFGMTPHDAVMLARTDAIARFYDRGDWHVLRLHIPAVHSARSECEKLHLTVVFNRDTVVTMTDCRIPSLERLLQQQKKTIPRELRHGAVGDVLAWLLSAVLDAVEPILDAVHARIEVLGKELRRLHGDRVTQQLGVLRRDILHLDLMVDPGRAVIAELLDTRAPYRPPRVTAALRGIADRLHAMHVVLVHNGGLVDALSQEHESVLAHRTNQTVQLLTVISVLLMPPTLVASYYGMNVAGLPWAHDIRVVTVLVLGAVVVFMAFIWQVIKR